eukprot:scaffold842_cov287-Chaetoceros_neogracile.AAC.15
MNDSTLPKPRRKTGVKKGFALHDWKLLLNRSNDLAQRKGNPIRSMSMEEVAQHNKEYDGWMVLHGKVYNVGPYLHYHPGGVGIMKPSLGKDGSRLFEQYHRWVGIDNLIGKMLIGYIDDTAHQNQQQQGLMSMPPPRPGRRKLDNLLTPPQPNSSDSDSEDEEKETI